MDSYLELAQTVLRSARRPMGAKAILDVAYQAGVVPSHLYGKTQQKTLQARLSEDILHRRETSPFYRTEPGQFFLTEFIRDSDIPEKWKSKFPARRRTRDLTRSNTLAFKRSFLDCWSKGELEKEDFFGAADAHGAMAYMHPNEMKLRGYCSTSTFTMVIKDDCVLAYRIGRYRDDRDAYAKRRSIGFAGALTVEDASLFSDDPLGAEDCAVSVLVQDLDLSLASFDGEGSKRPTISRVMVVEAEQCALNVVIVMVWHCPDWFEPTTRRLSLNDPEWLCTSIRHNDLSDFDPWSSAILKDWLNPEERMKVGETHDINSAGRISEVRTR